MDTDLTCRWCGPDSDLDVVLDLGRQPAADHFPLLGAPGSEQDAEPRWPLRMGLCRRCGLAQLVEDPGTADEPRGLEPQALIDQAHQAVAAVAEAGLLTPGCRVREFDSPHGGSWRELLVAAGAEDHTEDDTEDSTEDNTEDNEPVDLVVDVFGLMHDADQRVALTQRVAALAPGGTLLLQFHSLASIVAQQQWNALRHGHMAYYATSVLVEMLAELGLTARRAWTFDLYGGTVLLAADDRPEAADDPTLAALIAADAGADTGVGTRVGTGADLRTPAGLRSLAESAEVTAAELRDWLGAHRDAGRRVLGYGAASRAVPLLVRAGVDVDLLGAVADASPAKQGRRLPAGRIPIVPADRLRTGNDDVVLLFVPDLLAEVRAAYPEVEARGAVWAISEPRPQLV